MAIGGIETLRQLGLLGKANFKAAKSLTAWYIQIHFQIAFFDCIFGHALHETNPLGLRMRASPI